METEYELTFRDYIDIARRRFLLMLSVFLIVSAIAILFALLLPPVYKSSGTVLIESQQISSKIIASTVTGFASERIEVIKQRVMTRENMMRIIRKFNLFNSKDKSQITSVLVEKLREAISIDLLDSGGHKWGGRSTIAFSISYENRYPELAYGVTNELVTLFLNENLKSRVERATETTEFLSQEAKRLKNDLEKMESLVANYKQEHADSLPEHLSLKIGILERAQKRLAELDSEYKTTEIELKRLEFELAAEKSGPTGGSALSELEQLKAEYKKATLLYKDNHPTVRLLKHKIEALNKSADTKSNSAEDDGGMYNTVLVAKIKTMIDTTKSKLTSIEEQRVPLRKKITSLEQQIIKTPQVELGLSSLLRDHGNAKKKYEEIQSKQLTAQVAENLEGENKSERFTLIDPPLLPDKPIKPNRLKLIILGIFLAFVSAGGIAFMLETLNQKIRGYGALTTIMGQSPLVEIPYITTLDEYIYRKELIKKMAIYSGISLLLLMVLIHFLYMELDLLFFKIWARFE